MSREIKTKCDKGEGLSLLCVNVKCYHYTYNRCINYNITIPSLLFSILLKLILELVSLLTAS